MQSLRFDALIERKYIQAQKYAKQPTTQDLDRTMTKGR